VVKDKDTDFIDCRFRDSPDNHGDSDSNVSESENERMKFGKRRTMELYL